jgi:hypothetical protein
MVTDLVATVLHQKAIVRQPCPLLTIVGWLMLVFVIDVSYK